VGKSDPPGPPGEDPRALVRQKRDPASTSKHGELSPNASCLRALDLDLIETTLRFYGS
jgi:hypothetical protein